MYNCCIGPLGSETLPLEALTIELGGIPVIPRDEDDWDDWVSATQTRAHVLGNPLVDWLGRYGEKNGFLRDTDLPEYDERLEFAPFIMRKGVEFEAAIAKHLSSFAPLTAIAQGREDIRDLAAAEETFRALCEGKPIVHQAVLRHAETQTYGAADFLFRSDIFDDLFPEQIAPGEAVEPAPALGNSPWHYVVVDAKFTTLHLLVGGQVGNSRSSPAYKAHRVASGLTDGVWASPKALTSGDTIAGCLLEYATGLQVAQDSPHHRGGDLPALQACLFPTLGTAPSGVTLLEPAPETRWADGGASAYGSSLPSS